MKKITSYFAILLLIVNLCETEYVYAKENKEGIIIQYYKLLSDKNYEEALTYLDGSYYDMASSIVENELYKKGNIGLYNIKSATVLDIELLNNSEELRESYGINEVVQKVYEVSINFEVYEEDEFIRNGISLRYVFLNDHDKIIACTEKNDNVSNSNSNSGIMTLSYDTPIQNITGNPATIKVYRKKKNIIENISFLAYCKSVTTNEVGYETWDNAALRACALAIKNYGIARKYNKKYPDLGYDVVDDECDQVYDPDKKNITECNKAVNYIWYYFMYDKNGSLFPGFHVHSVVYNEHAKKNGGVLSQIRSNTLAKNNNYTWKEILNYFYTRKDSVDYYNDEVAVGKISIEYFYSK